MGGTDCDLAVENVCLMLCVGSLPDIVVVKRRVPRVSGGIIYDG